MRLALSSFGGRIAPVFDVSRKVVVLQLQGREIVSRQEEPLPAGDAAQKILRLSELGIAVLICGAVSQEISRMITAKGIELISFVAGDLQNVAEGYLTNTLSDRVFRMPGCGEQRRRRRKRRGGRGPRH